MAEAYYAPNWNKLKKKKNLYIEGINKGLNNF